MQVKYKISIIATATLSILLSIFISHDSTFALTYQSATDINFTINPTISVSLSGDLTIDNLTPGNYSDSNIITVSVTTNATQGYYLVATAGTSTTNTNLTHTNGANTFTSLSTNKSTLSSFDDNYWGYSYSTDNGTNWISGSVGSTNAGYNGLPLDSNDQGATGITIADATSPLADNSIKFKIGAKASNTQASGTYTNTVNFYAVTYREPSTIANTTYLQDVESCPADLISEKTFTLKDKRDGQEYTVAKLKDGKCWMTENLNLAGGTALSANDTDVANEYITSFTISNNLTKSGSTIILPASSTAGFDTDNYSYVYNSSNKTSDCASPGCYSYYSWDAATLGSGRSISTENTDAPYSICPKGWRLPTSGSDANDGWKRGDFYRLATVYGIDLENAHNADTAIFYNDLGLGRPANFLLSSYYYGNNLFYNGGRGIYWSSTSASDTALARSLGLYASYINSARIDNRFDGVSVRCLFSN